MKRTSNIVTFAVGAAFVIFVMSAFFLCGCGSTQFGSSPLPSGADSSLQGQEGSLKEQLTTAQARLDEARAQAAANLEAARQAGDAARVANAEKTLATVDEWRGKVATAANTIKTDAGGQLDISGTAASVGALLPPPWNLLAMIGVPLVVGGVQELRRRNAVASGKSIVHHIDAMMAEDPKVREALKTVEPETKSNARTHLTPQAAAWIESESVV